MSSTTLDAHCQPGLVDDREVAAFLCRYPDFFERHPEILTELSIPYPDSATWHRVMSFSEGAK